VRVKHLRPSRCCLEVFRPEPLRARGAHVPQATQTINNDEEPNGPGGVFGSTAGSDCEARLINITWVTVWDKCVCPGIKTKSQTRQTRQS